MIVWAITNRKGGTAKTTTAVNLAAALGERGERVLVVDLDAQGSASSWLGIAPERGLEAVFTDNAPIAALVRQTETAGVDLIPGSPFLAGLDRALAAEVGAEALLRIALAALPDRWRFVFVDTAPSLGLLAVSALVAADRVLVPVEPSPMAVGGLREITETLQRLRERLGIRAELGGIVVGRFDARTLLARDLLERLRERFGPLVFETAIRETVRLREAPSFAKPITTYAPNSTGAEDFRALAGDFLHAVESMKGDAR